jgi:hypothetical protein
MPPPQPRLGRAVRAHPFGVQVATIAGCLKAEAKTRSSIAFAASQAAALLYSAVAMATDPPESTKSVKMKVMWTSPGTKIPPQGKAALLHAWADQAAARGRCSCQLAVPDLNPVEQSDV